MFPENEKSPFASGEDLRKYLLNALKPDPIHLSVSEWADERRYLSSKSSAEPGRWKTDRTPYLREPMDSLSPKDPCESVTMLFGAQLGKTETGLNWIGYIMDVAPGPLLMVQPNDKMIKQVVRQRLDPAIAESPSLSEKVSESKSRDGSNSLESKDFTGGIMLMSGAHAPAGLASMPIRYLFLDEVDRYPGDVGGEGDPVNLARARTRTFGNSKELITSTPTQKGSSRVEMEYSMTDQRHFYVPCPDCGKYQHLKFSQLEWDKDTTDGKRIHHPETACYACEHCGSLIPEHKKTWMLEKGEWVPHAPEIKQKKGYFINSLYSPLGWYSWEQIVRDWINAQGNPSLLKTFVNTVLAEPWIEKGEVPDWEAIKRRALSYPFGIAPQGVLFITYGVDIQRDRIEMEVKGWGRRFQSWSIDYIVIDGDTQKQETWDKLWAYKDKLWKVEGAKVEIPMSMMAVDSSDQTMLVYTQVRKQADDRIMAIKGMDNQIMHVGQPKYMDIDFDGKKVYRGVKMWPVGVSMIKTELYGFLRKQSPLESDEPYPDGFCFFPDYNKEYFRQLTAEQRIQRTVNGKTSYRWEKIYERNEALDCSVYNRAASYVFGMDRFNDDQWSQLESRLVNPPEIKQNKKDNTKKVNPYTGTSGGYI